MSTLRPVDVRALVIERGNAFQDAPGATSSSRSPTRRCVAQADPLALRTVVDHLLDNAVKYSDGGPVVLGRPPGGGRIEVSVSDIGIGMDEDQARHCFDKFWQAESTDVRRFGGTGIGLYIVSRWSTPWAARSASRRRWAGEHVHRVALPGVWSHPRRPGAEARAGGRDQAEPSCARSAC